MAGRRGHLAAYPRPSPRAPRTRPSPVASDQGRTRLAATPLSGAGRSLHTPSSSPPERDEAGSPSISYNDALFRGEPRMEGISRLGFWGWTAWTALGMKASRALGIPEVSVEKNATREEPSPAQRAIDDFVERHRKDWGIPGLTLGLAGWQGIIAARTYGHADVKAGLPLTPQTLFDIGSITESFAALPASTPTRRQARSRPPDSRVPPLAARREFVRSNYAPSPSGPYVWVANPLSFPSIPLWAAHPPGQYFHYCNLGYQILGLLIETLDHRSLRESLRTRIL